MLRFLPPDKGQLSLGQAPPLSVSTPGTSALPPHDPHILTQHPVIILIKCYYRHSEDNWVLLNALFLLPHVPVLPPPPPTVTHRYTRPELQVEKSGGRVAE